MKHLSGFIGSLLLLILIFLVLAGLVGLGIFDINWPWENVDVASEDTTITYDEAEPEPKIIKIEAIGLACIAVSLPRYRCGLPASMSWSVRRTGRTRSRWSPSVMWTPA